MGERRRACHGACGRLPTKCPPDIRLTTRCTLPPIRRGGFLPMQKSGALAGLCKEMTLSPRECRWGVVGTGGAHLCAATAPHGFPQPRNDIVGDGMYATPAAGVNSPQALIQHHEGRNPSLPKMHYSFGGGSKPPALRCCNEVGIAFSLCLCRKVCHSWKRSFSVKDRMFSAFFSVTFGLL